MIDNMDFETAMKRLEEISKKLEGDNASLDESLSLFEEGVALVRFCNSCLTTAEQKVRILVEGTDGMEEKDFVADKSSEL